MIRNYVVPSSGIAHILNDLPDSGRVRGVEDLPHQHGFDRAPHNPGGGVGLQLLHQVVAEWSCRERCYEDNITCFSKKITVL